MAQTRTIRGLSFRKILLATRALKHFPQTVPRKEEDIKLNLSGVTYLLNAKTKKWEKVSGSSSPVGEDGGESVSGAIDTALMKRMKNKIKKLQEENQMLLFKQEVMLHMMTAQSLDLVTYKKAFEEKGYDPSQIEIKGEA